MVENESVVIVADRIGNEINRHNGHTFDFTNCSGKERWHGSE